LCSTKEGRAVEVPLLDLRPQFEALREEIYRAVREVIESQKFVLGPQVESLENELARFTGTAYAVGCASGTDALILSLAALDVGDGDHVLTTPFSFTSTASCAYRVGARPVFADILPDTFNIDPDKIETSLTPRTKAIIPVHLFGQCAEMDPILEIAERRGLAILEDAAQALSATYESERLGKRAKAGALGTIGAFSFFPSKNLGGFGDGGMTVCDDPDLADKLRKLRIHGGLQAYEHELLGWNSRLDALQAAVLRVKLPHLEAWSRGRVENADRYDRWFRESGLTESERVVLPHRSPRSSHIFNQYTLRAHDRDGLRRHLAARGIGHSVYYPIPLHLEPCFRDLGHREGDFPEAERAAREVVSLPVFPELAPGLQEQVVQAVVNFYR
jgi:dTDP-4-amino-4,6-dideoxygalactose transaminase